MTTTDGATPDDGFLADHRWGDHNDGYPSETAERITNNIALAGRLLAAMFDDPALIDDIAAGEQIVLLPDEDPDLAMSNARGAARMAEAGQRVAVYRIGSGGVTRQAGSG